MVFGLINRRLSIPARFMLLCLLFCASIALGVGLFAGPSWTAIVVTRKELAGVAYLRMLWPNVAAAADGGGGQIASDGQDPEAKTEAEFGATQVAAAFRRALGRQESLAAGAGLIATVADGSNLSIDPELDSFHAQTAMTVQLPAVLVAADALDSAVVETSPDRRADIAVAIYKLQQAVAAADAALTAAIGNDSSGLTGSALAAPAAALRATAARLAAAGRAAEDTPTASLGEAETALHDALDASWDASATELARLLNERLSRQTHALIFDLGLCLAALLAAASLASAVARGLSNRIEAQAGAMEKLAANDLTAAVPGLEDRNETGRVAAALERIKLSLLERDRLRDDAELRCERSEQKARQAEAALKAAGEDEVQMVEALGEALARLAEGDLTAAVTERVPAGYAGLKAGFNAAVERLADALVEVRLGAREVRLSSHGIAQAADDLSHRAEQEASRLERTAAALDQITAAVNKTASGAREVDEVVSAAKAEASRSDEVVSGAARAMGEIETSSRQIGQIIGVIDEIAFQTNLLALNAGVEAARAGESGRGFAVIASEVRTLAQRSAEASKQIKTLVAASSAQVGEGVGLVAEAGQALRSIAERVAEVDALIGEIAASAREQAVGLSEVNGAVSQMDQALRQNAAMVVQSTAAAHALKAQTTELACLIARLNLRPLHEAPRGSLPRRIA